MSVGIAELETENARLKAQLVKRNEQVIRLLNTATYWYGVAVAKHNFILNVLHPQVGHRQRRAWWKEMGQEPRPSPTWSTCAECGESSGAPRLDVVSDEQGRRRRLCGACIERLRGEDGMAPWVDWFNQVP